MNRHVHGWPLLIVALSAFLISPDCSASEPHRLTLEHCIQRVLELSPDLMLARDQIQVQAARVDDARRDRWPAVSASLSDNRIIDVEEFSYYDPVTGQTVAPGEGYDMNVSLRLPLYTGARLSSEIRAARFDQRVQELEYQTRKKDMILSVISSYIKALERRAEWDVRREQVTRSEESLKLAEKRLSTGKGIRYEVLSEKAFLSESELEEMTSRNAYHQAVRDLQNLIRMPLERDVELEDVPFPDPMTDDTDTLLVRALESREDMETLQTQIETAQARLKSLRSRKLPNIDFYTSYNKQGTDLSDFSDDAGRVTAGLSIFFSPFNDSTVRLNTSRDRINSDDFMQYNSISFSLFDNTSTYTTELELRINREYLQRQLENTRNQITAAVLAAYENQAQSWKSCQSETLKLAAAEENYSIEQKRYDLGLNHFKDVVDARTDVIAARINVNFSRYLHALDRAILTRETGSLEWSVTP